MKLILERFRTQFDCDKQINGIMFVEKDNEKLFHCFTLELPDKQNQKKVSHIPIGNYKVVKRNSPKYGNHFHILDVPNRDLILIHQGNYYTQIEGCVLVGDNLTDVNNDKILDVTNSVATMKKLLDLLPNNFEIQII